MTRELRQAAERRRAGNYDAPDDEYWMNTQNFEDMKKLADAYLAEHPADDEEPVTEEWLRAVGFKCREWDVARWYEFEPLTVNTLADCACSIDIVRIGPRRSRGEIRRLCAALGVPLKETP